MTRNLLILIVAFGWLAAFSIAAIAQDCGAEQFDDLIDRASDKLKDLNASSEQAMERDLELLAKQKGWPITDASDKGLQYLSDEQTRTLDQTASELLIRLDFLSDTQTNPATCARLAELRKVIAQLLEVTIAKQSHIKAKLAVAVRPKLAETKKARTESTPTKKADDRVPLPSLKPQRSEQKAAANWSTNAANVPPPQAEILTVLPPIVQEQDFSFSADEIRAAGRGFFGSISAELAAVINFAFDNYGKPNAYIVGKEGTLAFVAGLRYGQGELISKRFPKRNIYWQGPSIGTDLGLTGSRVMVLVYNLDQQESIFQRFAGVESAAYLVGGVGITFHKQGPIVLAPIRTGLGLRIGANLGYLKITPQRQLNPF